MTAKPKNVTTNHKTFGGRIYTFDFDTEHSRGNIINRIIADRHFDEQCRKNCENRERKL